MSKRYRLIVRTFLYAAVMFVVVLLLSHFAFQHGWAQSLATAGDWAIAASFGFWAGVKDARKV